MERLAKYPTQKAYIIVDLVADFLSAENKFIIIDGGAREAFEISNWTKINKDKIFVHGFETDIKECESLNREAKEKDFPYAFHPIGLWSKKDIIDFNVTVSRGSSSCFKPNLKFLDRLYYTAEDSVGSLLKVDEVVKTQVTSVDLWSKQNNIENIDFVKLNIQGAELEVLKGSLSKLPDVLGLQLEMSFVQTWQNGPLFAEIDTFVRSQGFVFFDFLAPNIVGRMGSPLRFSVPQEVKIFRWPSRQIFEGHFLYLRDPIEANFEVTDIKSVSKVLKLAAISEMYGQVEYSFELLNWLRNKLQNNAQIETYSKVSMIFENAYSTYQKVFLNRLISY